MLCMGNVLISTQPLYEKSWGLKLQYIHIYTVRDNLFLGYTILYQYIQLWTQHFLNLVYDFCFTLDRAICYHDALHGRWIYWYWNVRKLCPCMKNVEVSSYSIYLYIQYLIIFGIYLYILVYLIHYERRIS